MKVLAYDNGSEGKHGIPMGVRESIDKYWKSNWVSPWDNRLASSLSAILSANPKTKGFNFLDLGCGSSPIENGENYSSQCSIYINDGCFPVLPLAMQALGANVMGIDHGEYGEGFFPFKRGDLCRKGSLDFIPDHSIDIAHAGQLFDSPTLQGLGYTSRQLQERILPQLKRVVKPKGYFIYSGMASDEFKNEAAIIFARESGRSESVFAYG